MSCSWYLLDVAEEVVVVGDEAVEVGDMLAWVRTRAWVFDGCGFRVDW